MPRLDSLFETLDWDWIADGRPGRFHGDYHFENILWSPEQNTFTLLDWRQEFGSSLSTGDVYYDLAKLLHGLIVNHELIVKDLFTVCWEPGHITYDLLRRQVLVDCENRFLEWVTEQGYDAHKVRVMTALIYLNIAALHHYPYCLLLYALGKSILHEELGKPS